MRKMIFFYAWQSDTERKLNSDFIDIALREAVRRVTEDSSLGVEVQIDSDTQVLVDQPTQPRFSEFCWTLLCLLPALVFVLDLA
jgi:hypothetical protein